MAMSYYASYGYEPQAQGYYSGSYGYGPKTQAQTHYGGSYYGPQAQGYYSGGPQSYGPDCAEECMIGPGQAFPPGTDPKIVECFNRIDRDGNGLIDDKELQYVLSSLNQEFSLRTVHLLMCSFTHNNRRAIGPKEFLPLMKCLQQWRATFQRFDWDRNGRIDASELRQALQSFGYPLSPAILNLLISNFDKSGARFSIGYDNFIECCITVKGLTEAYKAKEEYRDCATFTYEEFLLSVLPFIIA